MLKRFFCLILHSFVVVTMFAQGVVSEIVSTDLILSVDDGNVEQIESRVSASSQDATRYIIRSTLGINGLSKIITTNSGTYIFRQSIGQSSVIGTYSKGNYTIRQGFLQPIISRKIVQSISKDYLKPTLYPNPFSESISISFDEIIVDDMFVEVYNISGKILFSRKYSASQLITFSLNYINGGQYIIKITSGNKQFVSKLIKN